MSKETSKEMSGTAALGRRVTRAGFLGLTPEDEAFVAIRLALHRKLKEAREAKGLTQSALAARIGSSQSRVAKAEAGAESISLDLLLRAMLATGATPREIGEAIATAVAVERDGEALAVA